jgi:integrase
MARETSILTAQAVAKEKTPGLHADGAGLYLRVGRNGAKNWTFRYMLNRRSREMGLGGLTKVGLADARKKAADARRQLADGLDPLTAKSERRAAARVEAARSVTFDDCADAYLRAHEATWKNSKHRKQWRNTLDAYVSPVFGKMAVKDVDVSLVMKVLEPIWHKKPETASRVRGRIETVLDWAKARGFRTGENPARWRGHLNQLLPAKSKVRKVKHHPALPYAEVGAFMTDLRSREGLAADALEFLILTVARTSEVIGTRWREVDEKARLWTIPAERMKREREHRVPLSAPALAVLKRMRGKDPDFVFPGLKAGASLSDMAMLTLIGRMNTVRARSNLPRFIDPARGDVDVTPHGFRSSFRDWASERTNFAREVAEMALAHVIDDKTEAAYRRGDLFDKRRRMMGAWAEFCAKPTAAGSVVDLRPASARPAPAL